MSRKAAQAIVDKLNALSRVRELTDQESWQLQKMLNTLKRQGRRA